MKLMSKKPENKGSHYIKDGVTYSGKVKAYHGALGLLEQPFFQKMYLLKIRFIEKIF